VKEYNSSRFPNRKPPGSVYLKNIWRGSKLNRTFDLKEVEAYNSVQNRELYSLDEAFEILTRIALGPNEIGKTTRQVSSKARYGLYLLPSGFTRRSWY